MEQERKAREAEEKERVERMKKIKDQFADPNGQWEKDKTDIQNEALIEKAKEEEAAAAAAAEKAKVASSPAELEESIVDTDKAEGVTQVSKFRTLSSSYAEQARIPSVHEGFAYLT